MLFIRPLFPNAGDRGTRFALVQVSYLDYVGRGGCQMNEGEECFTVCSDIKIQASSRLGVKQRYRHAKTPA